jgi:hypothetical protein
MAIASGQNTTLSIKEETTYGTAATGNYTQLPFSTESLTFAKTNFESGIITGDREVRDVIMGSHSVTGDVSFDLSYQAAYLTMLQGLLGDDAISGAGLIEIGNERQSYSIQKGFVNAGFSGGTDDVHKFTGCEINSFGLTIPADGLVQGTFGIIGSSMTTEDTVEGTTVAYTDANDPFHSSAVTIEEGGSGSSIITDLSLNIDNGIATTNAIGALQPIQGGIGKCRVTGSLTAHFTSGALYEKFVANTVSSLDIEMGTLTTGLKFTMPEVKYTTGVVNIGGEGLISVQMDFVAMRDDGSDSSALTIDTDLS